MVRTSPPLATQYVQLETLVLSAAGLLASHMPARRAMGSIPWRR
jgi:hypothetical protein